MMHFVKQILVALFSLSLLISTYCRGQASIVLKNGISIENIVVISGTASEQIKTYRGFVIIDDGKIVFAGRKRPYLTGHFQTINGEGKYIIPGLIDSHVHTGQVVGFAEKHYEKYPDLTKTVLQHEPKAYLYFGFTTLIDLGDRNSEIIKLYQNSLYALHLFGVGHTVRQFDGYGHNFFKKPEIYTGKMFNWVYNPDQLQDIPGWIDIAEHTPQVVIQNAANAGAIAVKTFYEDGFSGVIPGLKLPADVLLKEIVHAAHLKKIPVILHATSVDAYKKGLVAGVDILAHGLWHFEKGNFLDATPPARLKIEELIGQIVEKGIFVQPTMRVVLSEKNIFNLDLLSHPDLKNALPPAFIDWFDTPEGKWGQEDLKDMYLNSALLDKHIAPVVYLDSLCNRVYNMINLMKRKGVKFIFGTDTPTSAAGLGGVAGLNGLLELQALEKAGLSLEEIFFAATIRNALAFKLNDRIGSVETGKNADLLILHSNPLININAYNEIETVIIGGKMIQRADLSATR